MEKSTGAQMVGFDQHPVIVSPFSLSSSPLPFWDPGGAHLREDGGNF